MKAPDAIEKRVAGPVAKAAGRCRGVVNGRRVQNHASTRSTQLRPLVGSSWVSAADSTIWHSRYLLCMTVDLAAGVASRPKESWRPWVGKKSRTRKAKTRPGGMRSPAKQGAEWAAGASEPLPAVGTVPPVLARATSSAVPVDVVPALRRSPKKASSAAVEDRPVDNGSSLTTHTREHAQGCAAVADIEPQGLAATYSFKASTEGGPSGVAIRFAGTRNGVKGKPGPRDRFERIERVGAIPAAGGRVAITTRVHGINAGEWRVTATPVEQPTAVRLPRRTATTSTYFAKLAYGPGVRLVSWPALVGLGVLIALALQVWLLARARIAVIPVLGVSLAACVLGYVGAKAYYLVLHRKHPRNFLTAGACIQGFLAVAFAVVAVGAWSLRLPVGLLLDVSTPGILLAMAVGRPGCFLTGCCAGRPTASRWGMWSSDRRVGIRRFPVQLAEAVVAMSIGVAALAAVLTAEAPMRGLVFVGAVAAYTFARQLLFPLRADTHTPRGRAATMVISGLALIASVVLSLVG